MNQPMTIYYRRDEIRARVFDAQARLPRLLARKGPRGLYSGLGVTVGKVAIAVAALDPDTCSADALGEAEHSHGGRIANLCNECMLDKDVLLELGSGEYGDYESSRLRLCGDCLGKALAMLAAAEPRP